MLDTRSKNKLEKMVEKPHCPVCDGICYESDATDLEYVKTKRGTEIFIHTKCVKKWGDE